MSSPREEKVTRAYHQVTLDTKFFNIVMIFCFFSSGTSSSMVVNISPWYLLLNTSGRAWATMAATTLLVRAPLARKRENTHQSFREYSHHSFWDFAWCLLRFSVAFFRSRMRPKKYDFRAQHCPNLNRFWGLVRHFWDNVGVLLWHHHVRWF